MKPLQSVSFAVFAFAIFSIFILATGQPAAAMQEVINPRFAQQGINRVIRIFQQKNAGADQDEEKKKAEKAEKDDEATIDTAATVEKTEPVDPKMIRLHMWDGSIVSGQVAVEDINVQTEFGTLKIPIQKIIQFHPGLETLTDLDKKIKELVEKLGARNFDERKAAHRELASMGPRLKKLIDKFDDGGSAERKKHLKEIKQEILEQIDEGESDDGLTFVNGDTVETPDFTVVGKILESTFKIKTKYGLLEVSLADIQQAERKFSAQAADVRKQITIGAKAFWQTSPVSTKIRVNRGDRISITATGTVVWQNWGNLNSTPDGISNQGQWRGIQSGTLVAKIGKSNTPIKVGSKGEFVAKSDGVLYLCIAIQDNYASNNGYRWNGEYKAKVTVRPATK